MTGSEAMLAGAPDRLLSATGARSSAKAVAGTAISPQKTMVRNFVMPEPPPEYPMVKRAPVRRGFRDGKNSLFRRFGQGIGAAQLGHGHRQHRAQNPGQAAFHGFKCQLFDDFLF